MARPYCVLYLKVASLKSGLTDNNIGESGSNAAYSRRCQISHAIVNQSGRAIADHGLPSGMNAAVRTAFTAVDNDLDAMVAQVSRDRLTSEAQDLLTAFAFDKTHQQHEIYALESAEKLTEQEV